MSDEDNHYQYSTNRVTSDEAKIDQLEGEMNVITFCCRLLLKVRPRSMLQKYIAYMRVIPVVATKKVHEFGWSEVMPFAKNCLVK